jgi:hypothetical protein
MLMQWSSCGPPYLNLIRCLCISEKYSFASLEVEVPKPVEQQDIQHHDTQRNNKGTPNITFQYESITFTMN